MWSLKMKNTHKLILKGLFMAVVLLGNTVLFGGCNNLNNRIETSEIIVENSSVTDNTEEISSGGEGEIEAEQEVEEKIEFFEELPTLEDVDPEKYPMMYDFLYSAPGYKMTSIENGCFKFGSCFIIAKNEKKDILYVERYEAVGGDYFPILGSAPVTYELSDADTFYDYYNRLDKKNVIEENGWQFIFLDYVFSEQEIYNGVYYYDGSWGGINLLELCPSAIGGLMYNEIYEENKGWPMEWIRRMKDEIEAKERESCEGDPYHPSNYEDSFWDKYPLGKLIKLEAYTGQKATFSPMYPGMFWMILDDPKWSGETSEEEFDDMISSGAWKIVN